MGRPQPLDGHLKEGYRPVKAGSHNLHNNKIPAHADVTCHVLIVFVSQEIVK